MITPPTHDPHVPHHDLDDEAGMRHLDIEYRPTATAVHCGNRLLVGDNHILILFGDGDGPLVFTVATRAGRRERCFGAG